jgi:hypothetical protein
MRRFCGLLLSFCFLASAQDKPARKALSAFPDNGFQFAGTWDCAGTFGNGKTHKALFTGTTILAGKWLELTERGIEPETGYLAKYLIGYDSEHSRLVEFDANNFGAVMYTTDEGWQNQVLTMTDNTSRFVYSVTGTDSFTVDWQARKTADSKWMSGDHLVCKHSMR